MTFQAMLELVRKEEPDYPAGELAVMLTAYFKDICNEVESMSAVIELVADGSKTEFLFADMADPFNQRYMKPRDIEVPGQIIHPLRDGIDGDIVYEITADGLIIGFRDVDMIRPLLNQTKILFEYFSYPPDVTIATTELPLPSIHSALLWKIKADLFAEKREWDRAGYYNRRAERSLVQYRRMVQGSGIRKIINTNTRI